MPSGPRTRSSSIRARTSASPLRSTPDSSSRSSTRTIAELAAARADIVTRARANKLRQEDLDGGTFTISNLGMFGVEQFVAVLNPPQAAILAVGAIEPKAVPTETGFEARPLMTMTLTCDHRALDGATAADFLRTV